MALVDRRYAEALIDIALQDGALDGYQEELGEVSEAIDGQEDVRHFLLNPEVRMETKKEIIIKAFSGKIRDKLLNFLLLLVDKSRISNIRGIYGEYVSMADKKRNVLNMVIYSADVPDKNHVEAIREKYGKLYGASSVTASVQIDRSLIGGLKVQIGDRLIDASIKGKLDSLKNILINSDR